MKPFKTHKNATRRIFAVFSVVCIIIAFVGVFAVGVSADSSTTANFTVLYNAIVSDASTSTTYTFNEEDFGIAFSYTTPVLYMVYSVNTSSGVWSISTDGLSKQVMFDGIVGGQGYRITSAYLENFTLNSSNTITLTNSLKLQISAQARVEYIIIADEAHEQDAGYFASFLCDMLNDGYSYDTFMLYTIENATFNQYNNGFNVGYADGYDDGYDDGEYSGYDEGYGDGHNIGYNEAMYIYLDIGYQNGYNEGKDIGYNLGYTDGSDGVGLEKLPFAITDSIANMFVSITDFEILGINVLGLLGSLISIVVVAFVIKKVF